MDLGLEDRRGLDKGGVRPVGDVEVEGRREALRGRPEECPGGRFRVLRERVRELPDPVMELRLKLEPRPPDALVKGGAAIGDERIEHALEVLFGSRITAVGDVVDKLLRVLQVRVGVGRGLLEQAFELGPRKGQTVLNVVGETVERAHGSRLLGRIPRGAVVLREPGDDVLRVALGAEGSALEQRLAEVDASRVDVQPRIDVVKGVDDEVFAGPELAVEDLFRVGGHAILQRLQVQAWIDLLRGGASNRRLGIANIPVSEQKLPAQVALLDGVVVRDGHPPRRSAGNAHQGHVLEELTAQGSGSDQKYVGGLKLALHGSAKDGNLIVIAAALRRQLLGAEGLLGQALDGIEIEPLENGVELTRRRLHHLLADDASEGRGHRVELGTPRAGQVPQDLLIQFHPLSTFDHLVRDLYHGAGVRRIARPRGTALRGNKLVDRAEANVQNGWPVELGEVRHQKLSRGIHALGQALEAQRLGLLDLRDDAPLDIGPEAGRVDLNLQRMRLGREHLDRSDGVHLAHTIHLGKNHHVA
mmetsp:Transcript_10493/g.28804  ORF Transcript_10493/g.28804 Transcript_10493/m.28804 type:complete len:530 (+) Transcript_10493:866-2455(+)